MQYMQNVIRYIAIRYIEVSSKFNQILGRVSGALNAR